jgi:bacterioferritin (cytochrome b1)
VEANQALVHLTAAEILASLAQACLAEQQAVVDYHARALAAKTSAMREALETLRDVEQEHAVRIAARITALGGTLVEERVEPKALGDTLVAGLTQDLIGEQWAIVEYARLVAGIVDDGETAELMAELLADEIRHARWLKATLQTLQPESQEE